MENIVTGTDNTDPRQVVMERPPYPKAVEWGQPLPGTTPTQTATDLAQTVALEQQVAESQQLEAGVTPVDEVPLPTFQGVPNYATPQSMFANLPGRTSQWLPNIQPSPRNTLNPQAQLPPVFNANTNPVEAPRVDLNQIYGTTPDTLVRQSRIAGQAYQQRQVAPPAPTTYQSTPSSDPRVPQPTRGIFNGNYNGSTNVPAQPQNAWDIGRELGQAGSLISGFVNSLFTQNTEDFLNPATNTSTPQFQEFVRGMAPVANPEANANQPWYFNPGRGYFGEMGTGLRGGALYGLGLTGNVVKAAVYSITDLGRYLVGGEDNLPGNVDDYRVAGFRFQQALTGQDLGSLNIRDNASNRYLSAIDPKAPLPVQIAQGVLGFGIDAIGFGWVDDVVGEVVGRGARQVGSALGVPSFRNSSVPAIPSSAVPPSTYIPQVIPPSSTVTTEFNPVIPSTVPSIPFSNSREFIPFNQFATSPDPSIPIPQRVYRTNAELSAIIAEAMPDVVPPNLGVLTTRQINIVESVMGNEIAIPRYGAVEAPIPAQVVPDVQTQAEVPPSASAAVTLQQESVVAPEVAPTPREVLRGAIDDANNPEGKITQEQYDELMAYEAPLELPESVYVAARNGDADARRQIVSRSLTPVNQDPLLVRYNRMKAAQQATLPNHLAPANSNTLTTLANTGEELVASGRAERQLSGEMIELQEQLRLHQEELMSLPKIGRNPIDDEIAIREIYKSQSQRTTVGNDLNHPLLNQVDDRKYSFFDSERVKGTIDTTGQPNQYSVNFEVDGNVARGANEGAPVPFADLKAMDNAWNRFQSNPASEGMEFITRPLARDVDEFLMKAKNYESKGFDIYEVKRSPQNYRTISESKITFDQLKERATAEGFNINDQINAIELRLNRGRTAPTAATETLYHGSKQVNIERISPNAGSASNELGAGLYLTSNAREAELYAKAGSTRTQSIGASTNRQDVGLVHQVEVTINKALDVDAVPPRSVSDMMQEIVTSVYDERVAKRYRELVAGTPLNKRWLAAREAFSKTYPSRPISELTYQEFQRQVADRLVRRGYDALDQPSRGVKVLLDTNTGIMPLRTVSSSPVGVGTALESARARRLIDQQLHNYYNSPVTEVMALQSRVGLEAQSLDELIKAYEESLVRGENVAENFLAAEKATTSEVLRLKRDKLEAATSQVTEQIDELAQTERHIDGDESICL